MDISFQSLLFFTIITILYFAFPSIGKPELKLEDLSNEDSKTDYYSRTTTRLALYVGIVVLSQFVLNINYLMGKCGGALKNNIGVAALFTFIPWILIFGILVMVLVIFPGFKSAFSDVVGYYAIAMSANELFGSILKDTKTDQLIENAGGEEQAKMKDAAEAILKICGNKGILINQMNPENFLDIWKALEPLMKEGMFTDQKRQTELLNLVVLKENIGEALWYIYTGILISSVVYFNLATRGCVKSPEQMKDDYNAYVKQQEEAQKQQALSNSVTYTN
jgi:hypothetical protein